MRSNYFQLLKPSIFAALLKMVSVELTSVICYHTIALVPASGISAVHYSLVFWAISDLSSPITFSMRAFLNSVEIEGSSNTFFRIEYL